MRRAGLRWLTFGIGLVVAAGAHASGSSFAPRASDSGVGSVLEALAGAEWRFSGASRHGADSEMISLWEPAADGRGYVGRGEVVQGGERSASVSLYTYHPRRGWWTYTSVSSNGAVQEAEELESSDGHFVFKGTSYRADGTQTTFVWTVTLDGADAYLSESMAYAGGEWRSNPSNRFVRTAR